MSETRRCSSCKKTKPQNDYYTGQFVCRLCQRSDPEANLMAEVRVANETLKLWTPRIQDGIL